MPEVPGADASDVVPPIVSQILGLLWMVLFAGRWIVVNFLLAASWMTPTQVADLDDRILVRCYIVLLIVTITILVLRATRAAQARRQSRPSSSTRSAVDAAIQASSTGEIDRRPDPLD